MQTTASPQLQALVMMLFNTKTQTYHPILYFEKEMPGGFDAEINQKSVRYKSKGHRTVGLTSREEAVACIETDVLPGCKKLGYNLNYELEGNMEWDGEDIPADVQIRPRPTIEVNG